jgi:hypothetical protein
VVASQYPHTELCVSMLCVQFQHWACAASDEMGSADAAAQLNIAVNVSAINTDFFMRVSLTSIDLNRA